MTMTSIKTAEQIENMRMAGRLTAQVLQALNDVVKPGITTMDIERFCEDYIINVMGAKPGSKGQYGYPYCVNTSVNHVICHGMPSEKQKKQKYNEKIIGYADRTEHQWMISAAMHAYGTTLLSAEQGLYASFCKCYYHSYKNFNNILAPLKHGFSNVAFLLGIGYRDEELPYFKNKIKASYEEIVNWK